MSIIKGIIIKYPFTLFILIFLIGFNIFGICKEDVNYSSIENKLMTKYKPPTIETILDKTYMENLETYSSDQFPYRNELISLNTNLKKYVLLENCINNVYFGKDGYLFVNPEYLYVMNEILIKIL